MGRLPIAFAGKQITFRIPYSMAAEMDILPNVNGQLFPDASFLLSIDKPMEIHRVIIRLTAKGTLDEDATPTILNPQPGSLEERIRLNITDFSKNEKLTKTPTLVAALLNRLTGTWEWEEPYTLVRAEGFQVQIDSLDFPTVIVLNDLVLPEAVDVSAVRVEIDFQGYLIIIAPPSETR